MIKLNKHSEIFHNLLNKMDDNCIDYIILRGFTKLPQFPYTDLDIAINPDQYNEFLKLCECDKEIFGENPTEYANNQDNVKNIYHPFFTVGEKNDELPNKCFRLDIYSNIFFFNVRFTIKKELVNIIFEKKIIYKKKYYIPSHTWEFILLLFRILYDKQGQMNDKHSDRLNFLITQFSRNELQNELNILGKYHPGGVSDILNIINKKNLIIDKFENHAFIFWTDKAIKSFDSKINEHKHLNIVDSKIVLEENLKNRYKLINDIYEVEIPFEHIKIQCKNPILIFVVQNKNPVYEIRKTSSGVQKIVNTEIYNLKNKLREGFSTDHVHASDEVHEANKVFGTFGLEKYFNKTTIISSSYLRIVVWSDLIAKNRKYSLSQIENSPHFLYLTNNQKKYVDYLNIEKEHTVEEFDKLINKGNIEKITFDKPINTRTLNNGLYCIIDGAHRASLMLYSGYNNIIVNIHPYNNCVYYDRVLPITYDF